MSKKGSKVGVEGLQPVAEAIKEVYLGNRQESATPEASYPEQINSERDRDV